MCANASWLSNTCLCNRTGVVLTPHSYETKVTNGARKEEYLDTWNKGKCNKSVSSKGEESESQVLAGVRMHHNVDG